MTTRQLKIQVDIIGNAKSGLDGIVGSLGKAGAIAGGAAVAGIAAVGAGMIGAGAAGLSMNNSVELATARINAFTKDGAKTADILKMVTERAAKTPFAFNDMATAAAALLPSAKQAQTGLEDLIAQAEILAASNPAEGLEGAAFALKEAVSGDFTSIIERFNLPRQFINQLKDEGVPALEIVRRAMQELGLDADLVGSLANTASGRWSTFKDTLQGLAAQITQPIFDRFSAGLGSLNDKLTLSQPQLQAFAATIASGINRALDWLAELLPKLIGVFNEWAGTLGGTVQPAMLLIKDAIDRIAVALGIETQKISAQDIILKALRSTLDAVTTAIKLGAIALQGIAWVVEKVSAAVRIGKGLWDQMKTIVNLAVGNMKGSIQGWWDKASGIISKFKTGFNGIKDAIQKVVEKFRSMAQAAIDAWNMIPPAFRPGSPTPLEMGFRGIADAVGTVGKIMPQTLSNSPSASEVFGTGGGPTLVGTAAGAGGPAAQVVIHYQPMVSTASAIEIERDLIPLVIEGLRKRGVKV